ncbi:methyltransferase type 11 [Candidatus Vecturithrix granuli]|uniref:Methyltransferase type 11 n=1 Tax=Vecturithrix granuli TaxID=1499967 RepID=A0A081C9J1_VECG1|nr:methyltransferase type 11 [Candidatus Vecturithrix granuli]
MNSQQYFDEVANQWDTMRQGFFPEHVREKALAVAEVQAGRQAADIGAGSGFMTEGLIQQGLHVTAIDQSEAMLTIMQQKFQHTQHVEYRQGTAERLPLEDQSMDYVFANMYLHHVESPAEAIAEMTRILKPGGKLVITDLDEHHFEFLRTEQYDRWLGFKREDISRWFEAAGLKHVSVDCVGDNCCAQSNCGCEAAAVSIFVASGERNGC